jgi:hypothetical protein
MMHVYTTMMHCRSAFVLKRARARYSGGRRGDRKFCVRRGSHAPRTESSTMEFAGAGDMDGNGERWAAAT